MMASQSAPDNKSIFWLCGEKSDAANTDESRLAVGAKDAICTRDPVTCFRKLPDHPYQWYRIVGICSQDEQRNFQTGRYFTWNVSSHDSRILVQVGQMGGLGIDRHDESR
jgi:hypothetical protein